MCWFIDMHCLGLIHCFLLLFVDILLLFCLINRFLLLNCFSLCFYYCYWLILILIYIVLIINVHFYFILEGGDAYIIGHHTYWKRECYNSINGTWKWPLVPPRNIYESISFEVPCSISRVTIFLEPVLTGRKGWSWKGEGTENNHPRLLP